MSLFCTSFPALVAVAAVLVFKDDLVVVNKICLRTPCPAGVNVLLIIGHLLQVPPSNQISSYQLCFWCPRSYIEIFVMLLICVVFDGPRMKLLLHLILVLTFSQGCYISSS